MISNPTVDAAEFLYKSYQKTIESLKDEKALDCEFLVLQVSSAGKVLAHISEAGISNVSRKYIGDSAEYKRMLELRQPYEPPETESVQQSDGSFIARPLKLGEGEKEFQEISFAMERLTQTRKSATVGAISGNIIRVVDARISGELEYMSSVEVSLTPWEGKSGYSFLTSNSGKRGVGLYYRSGQFGFVFIVGDSEPCRKEYAATLASFIQIVKKKYGLNLEGGTWSD